MGVSVEGYYDELMIGCAMTACVTLLHAFFIALAGAVFRPINPGRSALTHAIRDPLLLVAASLWLMLAHLMSIWGWGLLYLNLDAVPDMEAALYSAGHAYTTLGLGEDELPKQWRLLSDWAAANGFLMFGLSTAFLFSIGGKLRIGD